MTLSRMWSILDNNGFRIVTYTKNLIDYISELVVNYPRSEVVLKDKLISAGYELLELVYLGNILEERLDVQRRIIVKISMLDAYLEFSYNRKCISLKKMQRGSRYLSVIRKMVYGWIKSVNQV